MSSLEYITNGKIDTSAEGLNYWAGKFKCSQKDLQEAVLRIGNGYTILLLYLQMNQLINESEA